ALAAWSIFAIFGWLRRGGFGQKWWRAYVILGLIGLALGIWFAFFLDYKVSNNHLEGFPIPVGISTREKPDAPWKKSDMPVAIRLGGTVTDLLSGIALCLAPIAVAAFFHENRGKGPFASPTAS
ncbi:MAG TPA: hypothetical protein VG754_02510, partial [Verrucomicrobiae bacterium]|nr:hypothetical protein [Verrucomicrobiae bacterium]